MGASADFSTDTAGDYQVKVTVADVNNGSSSSYDTVLYVLDGTCGGAPLACNDDAWGVQSQVTVSLTAGQTIRRGDPDAREPVPRPRPSCSCSACSGMPLRRSCRPVEGPSFSSTPRSTMALCFLACPFVDE
jgi:hypothetical protein